MLRFNHSAGTRTRAIVVRAIASRSERAGHFISLSIRRDAKPSFHFRKTRAGAIWHDQLDSSA